MQEPAVNLGAALQLDGEDSPSRLKSAPDVPPTLFELLDNKSLIDAAEDALSYTFRIGYEEANIGSTNSLFYFVAVVPTEMAQRGALHDLFERNLEKLTKFPTFMDGFTTRALASSRPVRPVAKFICARTREKLHFDNNIGKVRESLPPSPPITSSVSDSLIDWNYENLRRTRPRKLINRAKMTQRVI